MKTTTAHVLFIALPLFYATIVALQLVTVILKAYDLGKLFGTDEALTCELVQVDSIVRQPVNAWTSTVYALDGLLGFYMMRHTIGTQWALHLSFQITFLLTFLFLGIGSFAYHAFLNRITNNLDFLGMLMISLLAFCFSLTRWLQKNHIFFATLFWPLLVSVFTLKVVLSEVGKGDITVIVFGFFLGLGILGETIRQIMTRSSSPGKLLLRRHESLLPTFAAQDQRLEDYRVLIASAATLLLGFLFWILDLKSVWCDPMSFFQFHGFWHILSGYAALFLYWYTSAVSMEECMQMRNET